MSTEEAPAPESRPSDRWERAQQSVHWREIGISAVAAAARYAPGKTQVCDTAAATARPDPAEPRVVTLRDVEYFAA